MPKMRYDDLPGFGQVYQSWRAHEVTQQVAARKLGVSQSSFCRLKDVWEEDNDLSKRPPDLPDAFWDVLDQYDRDDAMSSRDAASMLGLSKTYFLRLARQAHEGELVRPQTEDCFDRFRHRNHVDEREQQGPNRGIREAFER